MKRSHLSSGLLALSMLASAGLAQSTPTAAPTASPTAQPEKKVPVKVAPAKTDTLKPQPKDPAAKPAEKAEPEKLSPEMQGFMDLQKPGPMHDRLHKCLGTWDCKVSMWMDPASDKATESTGKAIFSSLFEGKFVRVDFTGDMMGTPFRGYGLTGYDNMSKKFQSVWADSLVTGMMVSTGEITDDKKTINWTATLTGPDGKPCVMRQVETLTDDDHMTFTMYNKAEGQPERKEMMIEYSRVKRTQPRAETEVQKLKPETVRSAPAQQKAPEPKPVDPPKNPK